MADRPKVTKEMIERKKKPPAGYELKKVHHDEYSYKNNKGTKITVKAHDEHVLVPIARADKAKPKKVEKKAKPKKVEKKAKPKKEAESKPDEVPPEE